ncbi:MAG: hypothetical protein JSS30_02775 [Verrucomicrobia bacterium]|nr:hypothetical protein [Verrucomicrobiota bacterium]
MKALEPNIPRELRETDHIHDSLPRQGGSPWQREGRSRSRVAASLFGKGRGPVGLIIALLASCVGCYASEPAIYSLTLTQQLTLDKANIAMTPNMTPNTEITNSQGSTLFSNAWGGISVSKSGLYRVTVFQKVVTSTPNSSCIAILAIGQIIKRYKVVSVNSPVDEVHFTHVLRMNAGEQLQLILRPIVGPIELETGTDSSGFVIEEISSQ